MNAERPPDLSSASLAMDSGTRVAPRLRLRGPEPEPLKLSQVLEKVAAESTAPRISIGDLLRALDGRAFGALILVFAFPNVLPSPPGLAAVLGLPLIFLAAQLMLGRKPWLPSFIANRSITREVFVSLITRAVPWIIRAEAMLKQRLWVLVSPVAQRFIGAVFLMLSLVLVLPIPFGNMLPSLAICMLALGLLERDGLWVLAGCVSAVVATTIVGSMAFALIKSAIFLVTNAF